METNLAKIGNLISLVRQERNMTQADFAKSLGTSQSAINRIEQGKQNLSIEMLAKISDVLKKQLVSINGSSLNLRVEGGHELHGEIYLKTSKNAAVALLCASVLNHGTTRYNKFPRIEEVFRIIEVLESIGMKVRWLPGNDIEIKRPAKLTLDNINATSARKTRSVLMLIGSIMHSNSHFKIPYSGGCKLGSRTVSPHLYALEAFGVSIVARNGHYTIDVAEKAAGDTVLYEASDTATENAILAAAGQTSETVLRFASSNYMIQDLCTFLVKLGVKIDGIGTSTLRIRGVKNIKKNITYTPAEDPIEAMFFVSAAVTTNSELTIRRVPIEFMSLEMLKLEKMGLKFDISKHYLADNGFTQLADITVYKHNGHLHALTEKIHANVYPGINQDNLPYFVPMMAVVHGRSLIHDWTYENRAIYYTEMTKVGMNVELADPHRLYIHGPTKFSCADVVCPPALRPASLLLIGMLAAPGLSTLRNIYTINRGYEDLAERLNSIGAHITVLADM
jgi:UDP-N-acetylglucosamine 1-carboxyvinyltransferase